MHPAGFVHLRGFTVEILNQVDLHVTTYVVNKCEFLRGFFGSCENRYQQYPKIGSIVANFGTPLALLPECPITPWARRQL